MNRIFLPLAVLTWLLMAATLASGLALRVFDIRDPKDLDAQYWATVHRLLGITIGLAVVLVHSIVVTYFIGTTRWCREVVEAYSLSFDTLRRSNQLKRQTFPHALVGMAAIIGIASLGAAADPVAALRLQPPGGVSWTELHLAAACLGLALIAYGFVVEWRNILGQQQVINEVLAEVERRQSQQAADAGE